MAFRKQEAAVAEERLPEKCPWCGEEMKKRYLAGGRDSIRLSAQKPTALLGTAFQETMDLSTEGVAVRYITCWVCGKCRKLTLELPEGAHDL